MNKSNAYLPGTDHARRFEIQKDEQTTPAFVVRFKDELYAFENRCPHRGVELDWEPGEFFDETQRYLICSTHGALFEPHSGKCVSGPCIGESLKAVGLPQGDPAWAAHTRRD